MIVLVLTLLIFVVTLVAVGTKDSSSNSASTYTPTLMKSNKVLRQEAGTQPVEEPVEWVEDTAIEKREQRGVLALCWLLGKIRTNIRHPYSWTP